MLIVPPTLVVDASHSKDGAGSITLPDEKVNGFLYNGLKHYSMVAAFPAKDQEINILPIGVIERSFDEYTYPGN
jgi:hypothetical protein